MSDPFVAEIRTFGFNFAPTGWAQCNGALLPISQNTALFSLLGTMYGGDGKSTFALPDLQGSSPTSSGQGSGLSDRFEGEQYGEQFVTLLQSEIPVHTHVAQGGVDPAELAAPGTDRILTRAQPGLPYQSDSAGSITHLNVNATSVTGGSLPHNNMPPYLTLNYCIAMQGIFPQRP